jgi:hypothetical protein
MVREFPGFLLVKLLKTDKTAPEPLKKHPAILSLVIRLYRALFP